MDRIVESEKRAARNFPEVMTVKDVADYFGVHASTIYRMLKHIADRADHIPAYKVGSDWRFNKSSIDAWRYKCEQSGKSMLTV